MARKNANLSFAQACKYLELAPDKFAALREHGLVACITQEGRQIYPQISLELTRHLLALGQSRNWDMPTVAWYADLLFAAEIGRAILLPIDTIKTPTAAGLNNWLETPYAVAALEEISDGEEKADTAVLTPLRSLIAVAVGEGQFWPSLDNLKKSAIYPIITHFENMGISIIGEEMSIVRDMGMNFVMMMYAYAVVASPLSTEFAALVAATQDSITGITTARVNVSPDEQEIILKQTLIPVDKLYASKIAEIHSEPDAWDFKLGVLKADRRTIAIQVKLPTDSDKPFIDNIIDVIRPFLGIYGARVVQLLYEIANDPPHWRNPLITVDTNELLDRLGLKRDSRGVHYSRNRERLRDVLNAAHSLEIVGEFTGWEKGQRVRKAFYRTVLSLVGATFDPEESQNLSTAELRYRGLPKTMQIKLNFYDGIRRPDGKLGNQFVMMPRLTNPQMLMSARHSSTEEYLKAYILFRYRQLRMETHILSITRETALEKANITTKHVTRATQILTHALDKLVQDGTLESYSSIPLKKNLSFTVVLSNKTISEIQKSQ